MSDVAPLSASGIIPLPSLYISPLTNPGVGWTTETWAIYSEAIRHAEQRFDEERDRRYAEVGVEKEKALKIKETADLAALGLARDIQSYKDEKANELRSQIESERGHYATRQDISTLSEKFEVQLASLQTDRAGRAGAEQQQIEGEKRRASARTVTVGIIGVTVAFFGVLITAASIAVALILHG